MLLSQSVLEVRLTSNGSFEVICGSSNGLEFVTRVIYRQEQQLELVVENGIVVWYAHPKLGVLWFQSLILMRSD